MPSDIMCYSVLLCPHQSLGTMLIAPFGHWCSIWCSIRSSFNVSFRGQILLCFRQNLKIVPHNSIRCLSIRCLSIQCFSIRCFMRRSHPVLPLQVSKLCFFTPHCLLLHPAPHKKTKSRSAFGIEWKLRFISHLMVHSVLYPVVKSCFVLLCLGRSLNSALHCFIRCPPIASFSVSSSSQILLYRCQILRLVLLRPP